MSVPLVTKVLVADDHPIVRRGVRELLDAEPTSGWWPTSPTAPRRSGARCDDDVDLAILDVAMPRLTGLQAAQELAERRPALRLLVLSMHENEQFVFEALRAGASGYVLKTAADRDLVEACRATIRGEAFLYHGALIALVRDYLERARRGEAGARDELLTARELEVVKLVAEGHTSDEIAELLVISRRTVDRHRANILEKLELRDRVDVTRYAIRRGLIAP